MLLVEPSKENQCSSILTMQEGFMKDAKEVAEAIFSRSLGVPVHFHVSRQLPSSQRTQVFRLSLVDGPAQAPKTVIAKQSTRPYGFVFDGVPDGNIWQDWASLQFLSALVPNLQVAPAYYGGDQAVGLFMLQDMGDAQNLREILLQDDAKQAKQGLLRFFTTLGKLHAHTRGHQHLFLETRQSLGAYDPQQEFYRGQLAQMRERFQRMLTHLYLPLSREATTDLNTVISLLADPGAFLVSIHGDPAPFNCLVTKESACLIDFEYGTYAHALLDGAGARMLFPSCGFANRLPAPLLAEIETAYREALIQGCPEASDDAQFSQALTVACAYWAINFCVWRTFSQTLVEDCTWGTSTVRHLYILRAEQVAQTTEETG
jgi:hypothetical protein